MRRNDLAEFLRARRAALTPADLGIVPGSEHRGAEPPDGGRARRRTAGLRREEVARHAGVSLSWYTWLEQGRPINVSLDVLDALARTLRLDAVERDHLLVLAGHALPRPTASGRTDVTTEPGTSDEPGTSAVPASIAHLLDAFGRVPAYVLGPTWDYLAWNRAQDAVYPITPLKPEERNLVWVVFGRPEVRELIEDWEAEARQVLSQFRADTTPIRGDPAVAALVARLHAASREFAAWWPRHDVAAFRTRLRRYRHATLGALVFEYQELVVSGRPDLRVVVQLPLPGDDSLERLERALAAPPLDHA